MSQFPPKKSTHRTCWRKNVKKENVSLNATYISCLSKKLMTQKRSRSRLQLWKSEIATAESFIPASQNNYFTERHVSTYSFRVDRAHTVLQQRFLSSQNPPRGESQRGKPEETRQFIKERLQTQNKSRAEPRDPAKMLGFLKSGLLIWDMKSLTLREETKKKLDTT